VDTRYSAETAKTEQVLTHATSERDFVEDFDGIGLDIGKPFKSPHY
jgi:hypothetical protein